MNVRRTIPPVAAPVSGADLLNGLIGFITDGKEIACREEEMRNRFGVKHVFLVSSGKAALYLILEALKSLHPGKKEVILPAYTCFSVPSAVYKAGLTITPSDIDPETFDFDPALLAKTISEKTLCVIASHLFGIPSDIDRIREACKGHGITVVEDAAQAMGGDYKGRMLGSIGDAGFFSFGRGKNVTCGEGGVILTDSDSMASEIKMKYARIGQPLFLDEMIGWLKLAMLTIFIRPSLYWLPAGIPSLKLGETIFHKNFPIRQLSGMKAGILKNWQTRLAESNRIRRDNTRRILDGLGNGAGEQRREDVPFLRLPLLMKKQETRDKVFDLSKGKGLGLSKMYPSPVSEIEEIKDLMEKRTYPGAKTVCDRLIDIPVHPLLSERDKVSICKFFGEHN